MQSFIFGGDTGETIESLNRKRAIANQLLQRGQTGIARNTGEGLAQFGSALAGRLRTDALDRKTSEGVKANTAMMAKLLSGSRGMMQPELDPVDIPGSGAPVELLPYLVGNKDKSHARGIKGDFRIKLARFLAKAPDGGIKIQSGYRSPEHQKRLYDDAVRKYGSPEAARKWVAPPGKSKHNTGNAADLHYATPAMKKWAHENASKFGLNFRMSHEPWHIEGGGEPTFTPQQVASLDPSSGIGQQPVQPSIDIGQPLPQTGPIPQQRPDPNTVQPQPVQTAQAAPQQTPQAGFDPKWIELANSPYTPPAMRELAIGQIKQHLQPDDPMKALRMDNLRLRNEKLRNPDAAGSTPEYGLNPQYGVDANGNPVLLQLGKGGNAIQTGMPEGVTLSKKPIKIDAGPNYILLDPITRQPIGDPIPKNLAEAERQKALGKSEGKTTGEAIASYKSLLSKMPALQTMVADLDKVSERATYTYAGQARDAFNRQMGWPPSDGALARTEYIAKVDNQVLPLLRDTFGAAFTVEEGKSLRATLGDPDKTPEEKQIVLKAFIEQKQRTIESLARQTGAAPPQKTPKDTNIDNLLKKYGGGNG